MVPSLSLCLAAFLIGLFGGFGWAIGTWAWGALVARLSR